MSLQVLPVISVIEYATVLSEGTVSSDAVRLYCVFYNDLSMDAIVGVGYHGCVDVQQAFVDSNARNVQEVGTSSNS